MSFFLQVDDTTREYSESSDIKHRSRLHETNTETSMSEGRHPSSGLAGIDVDDLFAHPYRRYLLYYLYLYANPVQLPDVAHQITVWETNEPAKDHLQDRLRIYNALYHDHLPMLIEADVIEYNQEEDMIDRGTAAEALLPAVERSFRTEVDELLQAERCTFDDPNSRSE